MAHRLPEPNQKIENYSTLRMIMDLLHYLKPYKLRFVSGSLFRLTSDVLGLYTTYALAQLVNIFTEGNVHSHIDEIQKILILFAIAGVLNHVLRYCGKIIINRLAERVGADVESLAIKHLFRLDIAWHEKENTGNKLKRIQIASNSFTRLLFIWVGNIIEIAVNLVGIILIVMQFDRTITLLTIGFMVIYVLITKLLLKRAGLASYNYNVAGEVTNGLEFEALNNIRTVKVMSMSDTITQKIKLALENVYLTARERVFWFQTRYLSTNIFNQIYRVIAFVIIIKKIISGDLGVGFIVLYNGYLGKIWESVDELSTVSEDILVARYSISRLNEMLNEPITIDEEKNKKKFPEKWQKLEFKNVCFSYGDNEVLKDLSFTINRGEKIGVVGLSGAGKSTLFKLLLKEYEDFDGEILIDNVPIQKVSKKDYFRHTAVVLQDTEVFNMSLRDNIYLSGTGKASDIDLRKAIKIAHVNDFLSKLPNGIDSEIGEKGVRLSGGERQRLGIARAVYKQPDILLLDEATSHLDLESEEKIQDSLHQFFRNVTAVVIAHRLTTIREMDQILVLEDGKIVESGNFESLQSLKGRFYELWEKQRL